MAGLAELTGTGGTEDGVVNCSIPGISSTNLLIDLPPAPPCPEADECPLPAVASGAASIGAVPGAMEFVVVVDDGATPMVARGTVAPTLLVNEDGSLD